MSNPGMMLTFDGKLLLAKALTGKELKFSKVSFGAGDFDYETEAVDDLVELRDWKMDLPIVGAIVEGNGCALIKAQLNNYKLEEGFAAKEVGLYAFDPDTEAELLYAYRNAGSEYSFIPAGGGAVTKNVTLGYRVEIQNAPNITAVIDFSFVYVSQADFEEFKETHPPASSEVSTTNAFWVTGSDTKLHPMSLEDTKNLLLEDGNISLKQLDNLKFFVQQHFELGLDPNLLLLENFNPPTLIDNSKVKVLKSARGSKRLKLESLEGVFIGSEYVLQDDSSREVVSVERIVKNNGLFAFLSEEISKEFDAENSFLLRSNCEVKDAQLIPKGLIYSTAAAAIEDLKTAYILIHHAQTNLAPKVFVSFSAAAKENISETLGTATGELQSFNLENADVDFNSLEVFAGDSKVTDFTFDSDNSELTLEADFGELITAKYNTVQSESWQEAELQFTMADENFDHKEFVSRYVLRLDEADNSKCVKVKFDSPCVISSFAAGFSY